MPLSIRSLIIGTLLALMLTTLGATVLSAKQDTLPAAQGEDAR